MSWQCFMVEYDEDKGQFKQDGLTTPMDRLRPGALWFDAGLLFCRLPNGVTWCIDYPGKEWKRTGAPPHVTARPSILAGRGEPQEEYHGWLTDGVLSDDLAGRTYEYADNRKATAC